MPTDGGGELVFWQCVLQNVYVEMVMPKPRQETELKRRTKR
jgi:hypothetical protein